MTMQQPGGIKPERVDPAYYIPSYHQQQQKQQQQQQQMAPRMTQAPAAQPASSGSIAAIKQAVVSKGGAASQEDNIESRPDFPSIKGIFGWTTIDDVSVPYILRKDKQFVSVRIVEMKLLSRYPNSYPDDLGNHAPLTSFFVTSNEAKLLNEINLHHCNAEYGKKEFSQKELIVLLSEFCKFYELVKKTFPDAALARENTLAQKGGWLQIKNTVMPFIKRVDGKYVPLSVVQYAAGLLLNVKAGVLPTSKECEILNKACAEAGVEFKFSETTRLIRVEEILSVCQVKIIELPNQNPLKHAQYMELPTSNSVQEKAKASKALPPINPAPPMKTQQQAQQPQVPQNPYQFQHTSQLELMRSHLEQRMRANEINGVQNQGSLPYNNGMFDLSNPSNLYRMQFPPNGRPPSQRLGQQVPMFPGYTDPQLLYMQPHQQLINSLSSRATGAGPPNVSLPQPTGMSMTSTHNHRDMTNKSPGSTSSNPSPRSRPPSQQSRPPSGPRSNSRPPSGSPLSPTGVLHPSQLSHRRDSGYSGSEVSPPSSQAPGFPPSLGLLPHIYGLPSNNVAPHMMTALDISAAGMNHRSGLPHPVHVVSVPSSAMSGHERLISSGQGHHIGTGVPLGHKKPHDANQEIPGLYTPASHPMSVGGGTVLPHPTRVSTTLASPPPLVLMTTTVPHSIPITTVINATSKYSALDLTNSPSKGQSAVSDSSKGSDQLDKAGAPQSLPKEVISKPKVLPSKYADHIHGAWLKNKSISCLHLEEEERNGHYCLVEAVCKLYFNGCSVDEFLFALENVLNVPLLTCNTEEESAFINYYSLPVEVLKCNKLIKLDDLENFFPQLAYMFPDKNAPDYGILPVDSEQENNNGSLKEFSNGVDSASDLSVPMYDSTATGEKRPSDAYQLEPSAKHRKTSEGPARGEDAVIILD